MVVTLLRLGGRPDVRMSDQKRHPMSFRPLYKYQPEDKIRSEEVQKGYRYLFQANECESEQTHVQFTNVIAFH